MPRTTKTLAKKEPQPLANPAPSIDPETLEKALIGGDIGALNPAQRMQYYSAVCQSLSLNPLTRPLEFTQIDGKTVLYARKDCTEQLRRRDAIKITIAERKTDDGIHWVRAIASLPTGREDEAIGAVPMVEPAFVMEWSPTERGKKVRVANPHSGKPLSADIRAKNMMLAETKAKRRVTLSIAGLGIPDESELEQHFDTAPTPTQEPVVPAKTIEEAGGTVTVIQTEAGPVATKEIRAGDVLVMEPTEEQRAAKAETTNAEAEKLLDVKCHIGNAGGPWLEVAIRDMKPKALKALWDEVIVKMPEKPVLKEQRLRDAVLIRKSLMEADGTWPKDAQEAPQTPPEAQTTAPEPEKGRKGAKRAKEQASSEPPFDWRDVIIPIGTAKGKKLSELSDRMTELYCYGIPLVKASAEPNFIRGINTAMQEMNLMSDAVKKRGAFIIRAVADIGTTLKEIGEALVAAGILDGGRTKVSELKDEEIAHYIDRWDDVMEAVNKAKEAR